MRYQNRIKRRIVVFIVLSCSFLSACSFADSSKTNDQQVSKKGKAVNPLQQTMKKVEIEDRHIREGNRLVKEKMYQEAIDEYMKLEQYGGLYWRLAHFKIASCYSSLNQHEEALKFYQRWYDSAADWAQEEYKAEYNQYRQKAGLPTVE